MGYSHTTANYKLPQYVDDDRPSYLGDWNECMGIIDESMNNNKKSVADIDNKVVNLTTRLQDDERKIQENTTYIGNLEEVKFPEINSQITQLKGDKAPNNHASTETTYGQGTNEKYGHVKLTDEVSDLNIVNGTAITPYGLKKALSKKPTIKTFTSNFLSPKVSTTDGGYVKIVKKENVCCINLFNLRVNNTSGGIEFVPVIDLESQGISFTGEDYKIGNVIMSTDTTVFRYACIWKDEASGKPTFVISMPNNTDKTFIGELVFMCNE